MTQPNRMDPDAPRLDFLTVLGLTHPVTVEDVKQAYLERARAAHPDTGGSEAQFVKLQEAFEQATEYARFKAGRMQWLSQWVEQYAEQQQLEADLKQLGGTVEVKASESLTRTIGSDFATVLDRIVGIRLAGPKIDDSVMLHLGANRRHLGGLLTLELIDTAVTSIGLRQLHRFDNLRQFDLTGTQVNPDALTALLENLPLLETLGLQKTGIGWGARLKLKLAHRGLTIS